MNTSVMTTQQRLQISLKKLIKVSIFWRPTPYFVFFLLMGRDYVHRVEMRVLYTCAPLEWEKREKKHIGPWMANGHAHHCTLLACKRSARDTSEPNYV